MSSAGAIVGSFEMFDAVKAACRRHACSDATGLARSRSRLSSPPTLSAWTAPNVGHLVRDLAGGDRPSAYAAHNMMYLGPFSMTTYDPLQIAIRSFEDFKGRRSASRWDIADIFRAAGVATVCCRWRSIRLGKGSSTPPTTRLGDQLQPGVREIAKYIIMGPASTPCIHQPATWGVSRST